MKRSFMHLLVTCLVLFAIDTSWPQVKTNQERYAQDAARLVLEQPLPPMDGAHLRVTIREVTYAPGESSPPHTHPCPVIAYILHGAFKIRIRGQLEAIYREGQTFYEPPNSIHEVSQNASTTDEARLIAYFVCDHPTPVTIPITAQRHNGVGVARFPHRAPEVDEADLQKRAVLPFSFVL